MIGLALLLTFVVLLGISSRDCKPKTFDRILWILKAIFMTFVVAVIVTMILIVFVF